MRARSSVLEDDVSYDSGDYAGLLDKSLERIGWDALQDELKSRRAKGELVGAGLALFVEKSGLGPTDGAHVRVDTTGAIEVITGGASVGQGFETVMAQVCAETLGAEYRNIRVIHGRTDRIDFGIGAHASRATVMTANAVRAAALNVRAKALDVAAELMQSAPEALDIVDGCVVRRDARRRPVHVARPDRQPSAPRLPDAARTRPGPCLRRLVRQRAPDLPLRKPDRRGRHRPRHRRGKDRALCHRL